MSSCSSSAQTPAHLPETSHDSATSDAGNPAIHVSGPDAGTPARHVSRLRDLRRRQSCQTRLRPQTLALLPDTSQASKEKHRLTARRLFPSHSALGAAGQALTPTPLLALTAANSGCSSCLISWSWHVAVQNSDALRHGVQAFFSITHMLVKSVLAL